MMLHRIWVGLAALTGLPVAGIALLLVVPAAVERSPATLLLLLPIVLVVWAVALFILLVRRGRTLPSVQGKLFAFYLVSGAVSVWATTWELSREGIPGHLFSFSAMAGAGIFFLVPVMHLLFHRAGTEPVGSAKKRL